MRKLYWPHGTEDLGNQGSTSESVSNFQLLDPMYKHNVASDADMQLGHMEVTSISAMSHILCNPQPVWPGKISASPNKKIIKTQSIFELGETKSLNKMQKQHTRWKVAVRN